MAPPPRPDAAECICELWFIPNEYLPHGATFYLLTGPLEELTITNDKFRFCTFHGLDISPTLYKQNLRVHRAGVNDTPRRLLYRNGALIATAAPVRPMIRTRGGLVEEISPD